MKKPIKILLIALFWLGIWEIAALIVGNSLLFPSPVDVLIRLGELIPTENFIVSVLMSLVRVSLGIIIAVLLGVCVSVLCAKFHFVYELLYPIITIIKSTPVASFIVLVILFMGRDIVPTFITVLMVFPIVWSNVYRGIKNTSLELREVCKVYSISKGKQLKSLYFPSVMPYFISAILSGIGLGWKAGIAAEVLCVPLRSIGRNLYEAKLYIETSDMFAWTVTVVIMSLLLELLISKLVKRLSGKYSAVKESKNEA